MKYSLIKRVSWFNSIILKTCNNRFSRLLYIRSIPAPPPFVQFLLITYLENNEPILSKDMSFYWEIIPLQQSAGLILLGYLKNLQWTIYLVVYLE